MLCQEPRPVKTKLTLKNNYSITMMHLSDAGSPSRGVITVSTEMSVSNDIAERIKHLQGLADLAFLAGYAGALAILIGLLVARTNGPVSTAITWAGVIVLIASIYRHTGLKNLIDSLSKLDNNDNTNPPETD